MRKILNYINGEFCEPLNRRYLENINPAEGKPYSLVPDSDDADVHHAVIAAQNAFPAWSALPASERAAILLKIASEIDSNLETLALAESIDNGKPIALARTMDIPRASANIRFYATAAMHHSTDAHITDAQTINYTLHSPIGVAGCISPWNLPLYLFTWKIAPALAAGCTVVAKPSELTPMTAFLLAELCFNAGLPPGVLNIIHGTGERCGKAIIDHPLVRAISFTGGTVTGRKIATAAAPHFKKLSLELGGKNPNLVFADCDFENAVKSSVRSSFTNQGEICLCGSRIYVQGKIYDRFVESFINEVAALNLGDPLHDDVKIGALVSETHMNKVLSYIKLAVEEGGKIECGGKRVQVAGRCSDGYFVEPTVITGLGVNCRTNQEEIFGPVVTIQSFDSEDQALELANATQYGLSATIWTDNLGRAHRVASAINSGIVWVNCWLLRDLRTPFGGMKQSGLGREGGWDALKFFMDTKNICIHH